MTTKRKQFTGAKLQEAIAEASEKYGLDLCESGIQDFIEGLGLDYTPRPVRWTLDPESIEFEFAGTPDEALDAIHECIDEALAQRFPGRSSFCSYSIERVGR